MSKVAQNSDPLEFSFTRPRILALPLGGNRAVYRDSDTMGLVCRVGQSRSFWLRRWAKGAPRWIAIGDADRMAVEDARKQARKLNADIDAGGRPWEERAEARRTEGVTMGVLWETYLSVHALDNKRPNSVAGDCWLWARCIAPAFGVRYVSQCPAHPALAVEWVRKDEHYSQRHDRKGTVISGTNHTRHPFRCPDCSELAPATWTGGRIAADVTPQAVKALHASLSAARGATLANRAIVLLSTIFTKGAPGQANPCGDKSFLHQEEARDRFMSDTEVGLFWDAVEQEQAPLPLFFAVAATTGARKSNILAMPWPSEKHKEINLSTGEWKIPGHKAKAGKLISIQLSIPITIALTRWKAQCPASEWVFPSSKDPTAHMVDPSNAWGRIRLRMEAYRLLIVLGGLQGWEAGLVDAEIAGLPALTEKVLSQARGQEEGTAESALSLVVASIGERVRAAGGEPSENTCLNLHFHDIRRSVGAHLAQAGHSESEIGRLLGHAPGSKSTRIYARIGQEHLQKTAAVAAAKMLSHNPKAAGRLLNIEAHTIS